MSNNKTDFDAIELRQSRRAYLGTPIVADRIRKPKATIDEYSPPSGLSIRFIEDGSEAFQGIIISYIRKH